MPEAIFQLPDPGEGLTEATIVRWAVSPGQEVHVNDVLVEIETAKSLVELPCPWDGTVVELLVEQGAEVPVGTDLVRVRVTDAAEPESPDTPTPTAALTSPATTEDSDDDAGPILVGYGAGRAPSRRSVLAKPPVRRLAKDLGVDLTTIIPTGPGGIITREDVQQAAAAQQADTLSSYPVDQAAAANPAPPASDEPWLVGGTVSADGRCTRVPVKSVRRRTAENMVASAFTAPHVTVFHTVDVTRTMQMVADMRQRREYADIRITPLAMVLRAVALAVREHPQINASWDEDAQEIVYKHYVNLGVAASTPRGLLVPNIKDAHAKGFRELATELGDLTQRARSGRLAVEDMADGTITVTNIGVFGIDAGTPILNPGEAAILAFGAVRPQPWVLDGEITIRDVTTLALSFDHRLVDGELGSRFLAEVAALLEDPARAFIR